MLNEYIPWGHLKYKYITYYTPGNHGGIGPTVLATLLISSPE
jgi:hypothetical protein